MTRQRRWRRAASIPEETGAITDMGYGLAYRSRKSFNRAMTDRWERPARPDLPITQHPRYHLKTSKNVSTSLNRCCEVGGRDQRDPGGTRRRRVRSAVPAWAFQTEGIVSRSDRLRMARSKRAAQPAAQCAGGYRKAAWLGSKPTERRQRHCSDSTIIRRSMMQEGGAFRSTTRNASP